MYFFCPFALFAKIFPLGNIKSGISLNFQGFQVDQTVLNNRV